ncbi:MAG: Rid family hydrolase [Planctomycetota bacterium]
MVWRSALCLTLAGGLLALCGCPARQDSGVGASTPSGGEAAPAAATPETAEAKPATPRKPVEPSLRYVALDAPDGVSRAVVVEGHPLVHTRQLLPLAADGALVGAGSAEKQIEQLLANLEAVLDAAGSNVNKLVRLNVYADSPETVDFVRKQLAGRLGADVRPALTAVITPLPQQDCLVAVDAVAVADGAGTELVRGRCDAVSGYEDVADFAVLPVGGVAYLSGAPDKSPRAEAATRSLESLLKIIEELKLKPSDVVQMKVFIDSAAAADEVLGQIKTGFAGELVPPVAFVEWIASAPVEIEMIVRLPEQAVVGAGAVRFFTPQDAKPSPTFSRAALVQSPRQVYISSLMSRSAGSGEAQVRDVFAQLQETLAQTGTDMQHLAKATYYLSDDDRDAGSASAMLNQLRPEFYDPERPPAASKVRVHGVGDADRTLSMDMIAVGTDD